MLVAGLMSGTSADAIEVAVEDIRGRGARTRLRHIGHCSVPHSAEVRRRILSIAGGSAQPAQVISQLNFLLGELFASAVLTACRKLHIPRNSIKLIGSHGQTIYHQPEPSVECGKRLRSTLQIGEASVIAARTGIPTIADFRPADMAAGGQGAPLVPYFDYLLHRHASRGSIVLNIGGIANITAIPAGSSLREVMAFDTGPGNMVMDQLAEIISGGRRKYDSGGRQAARGIVDEQLVSRILREPYFRKRPPKSTGRELFGVDFIRRWFPVSRSTAEAGQRNALATATALTAAAIAIGIERFVLPRGEMHDCLVSGGGINNLFLMEQLHLRLARLDSGKCRLRVKSLAGAAVPSPAKEAAAFALLAYQTYHREPSNVPSATGARQSVILGKISQVIK